MSAIGLPMEDHIVEHFAAGGLCRCPCDECTTRLAKFCVCPDCLCDPDDPEAPRHDDPVWPVVPPGATYTLIASFDIQFGASSAVAEPES